MAVVASASVTLITVRDVQATYRYYKLQSSTSAVPTVPTSISTLPPSGWADTEPSYTEGSTKTLYTIDLTVFTDNTFYYTPVSVSSSYEAAKQAYNKALLAQSGVTNINTNLTNNYYTTTQADSKVSQTKSEILNSVSNTYTLKTDTQTLATRMTSAETALTADALTVKISSALANANGTTSVTTNGVTIDKNGLTVDGGAFKVTNASSGILSVGSDGTLSFGNPINISQLATDLSSTITTTQSTATTAQSTANSKSKTFTSTPTIPYYKGDLWKNGNTVYICNTSRTTGAYTSSEWTLTADKTSENTANNTVNVGNKTADLVVSDLNTATTNITNIFSDNIITPDEKISLLKDWNKITTEYNTITSRCTSCGVSYNTEPTDLATKYNALKTLFETTLAITASTLTSSSYSGSTIRNMLNSYQNIYNTLVTNISKLDSDNISQKYYNNITSRGQNLITNGTGSCGDNTNFSMWTYSGTEANKSAGSFYKNYASSSTPITDEYFPVESSKRYKLSFDIKSTLDKQSRLYSFIACYDIDKKEITNKCVMFMSNTTTTLSQDLNNGDTVVHFTDLTNWNITTTYSFQKGLIFWNYTNSFGYTYPTETYSRNAYFDLYTDGNSVDKSNNTITLKTAWTGGLVSSGTSVSQSNSGNQYTYIGASYALIPTTWTTFTGTIGGNSQKFREGTAYCRVGFFWNYNALVKDANEGGYLTNVIFGLDNASNQDLDTTNNKISNWCATNDTTLIDGAKIYTGTVTAKQLSADSLTIGNFDADMKSYMDDITKGINQNKLDIYKNLEDTNVSISKNSIANWSNEGNMNYINGTKIAEGTITTKAILCESLESLSSNLGTITTGKIQSENGAINMDFNDESKGIQIKSTSNNYTQVINSDGNRIYSGTDTTKTPVFEGTNTGAKMNELVVNNAATITGIRIEQKSDGWTWITGV